MVYKTDDIGAVDLFFYSPKEKIRSNPSLYVDHNPVANMENPVAVLEQSCNILV